MEDRGVQLSGYIYELPLHKQPVFKNHKNEQLPKTEYFCSNHICLPIYPSLSLENVKYIAETLIDIIK